MGADKNPEKIWAVRLPERLPEDSYLAWLHLESQKSRKLLFLVDEKSSRVV
nr:MAG TPA: hypothetical protein [Caudoviricetes sp.]